MVVSRALPQPLRPRVFRYGPVRDAELARELRTRGLELVAGALDPSAAELRAARGVVVFVTGDGDEGKLLGTLGHRFADHGLLVCLDADDDPAQLGAGRYLNGLPPDLVERRTTPAPHVFAELLARHDPGPAARLGFAPKYIGNIKPLSREDELLVARAFADCGEVCLEEMTEGLSGARVFHVNVRIGNSIGSWAQPLFAKIDRREKVALEAEKYDAVAPFIPFGLRPNVDRKRVVLGARRGVLVGNLVDKSESLWDVARRGHAEQAIFNLFNTTLGGLRAQGHAGEPVEGCIWDAMVKARILKPELLLPEYVETACERGAHPLAAITQAMQSRTQPYREGRIHGDLHADNVRVKGVDAILIDLASAETGPLAADLALLETWLAFAVHRTEHSEDYDDPIWRLVVDQLYSPDAFDRALAPAVATAPYRWIWDSVRQIRSFGITSQASPAEYRAVVVAALLRRCRYPATCRRDLFRRETAYELASALALGTQAEGARNVA